MEAQTAMRFQPFHRISFSRALPWLAVVCAVAAQPWAGGLAAQDQPDAGAPGREPLTAPEPAEDDVETIVRVQVFLDQMLFTPGKIDGELGDFTRMAVAHYNTRFRIKPLDNWHHVIEDSRRVVGEKSFVEYEIRSEDFNHVDTTLPNELEELAGRSWLPYRRLSEFVAERFHCDERFLYLSNPGVKWTELKAGDKVRVPNVIAFRIEDLKENHFFVEDPVLSTRHVVIDTTKRYAAVWDTETDTLVACFPITPGKEQFIHRGDWQLMNMMTTPEFRYDKSMLEQGVRSGDFKMLPPGPNSPVGVIWCGTSKTGIGLHGTSSPDNIGRSESAGCIRFSNWDAIRLPTLVRPGAKVTIR